MCVHNKNFWLLTEVHRARRVLLLPIDDLPPTASTGSNTGKQAPDVSSMNESAVRDAVAAASLSALSAAHRGCSA